MIKHLFRNSIFSSPTQELLFNTNNSRFSSAICFIIFFFFYKFSLSFSFHTTTRLTFTYKHLADNCVCECFLAHFNRLPSKIKIIFCRVMIRLSIILTIQIATIHTFASDYMRPKMDCKPHIHKYNHTYTTRIQ